MWWCSQLTHHGYRWHAAGVFKNLAFVLSFLGEEIIDLFFIWQARHHWVLVWQLAVISLTGVGTEGRGTLR